MLPIEFLNLLNPPQVFLFLWKAEIVCQGGTMAERKPVVAETHRLAISIETEENAFCFAGAIVRLTGSAETELPALFILLWSRACVRERECM